MNRSLPPLIVSPLALLACTTPLDACDWGSQPKSSLRPKSVRLKGVDSRVFGLSQSFARRGEAVLSLNFARGGGGGGGAKNAGRLPRPEEGVIGGHVQDGNRAWNSTSFAAHCPTIQPQRLPPCHLPHYINKTGSVGEVNVFVDIYNSLALNQSKTQYQILRRVVSSLEAFLQQGADPDEEDPRDNGWTPLTKAAHFGNAEIVKVLLKHGAHINKPQRHGATPLLLAVANKRFRVVDLLLYHGALTNLSSEDGLSPLGVAARMGNIQMAQMLLNKGADLFARTFYGDTPLLLASFEGKRQMVSFLLTSGARKDETNSEGMNAAHIAAAAGHADMLKWLLSVGFPLSRRKSDGSRALTLASAAGHINCVHVLLRAQLHCREENLDDVNDEHVTAFYAAALEGLYLGVNEMMRVRKHAKPPGRNGTFTSMRCRYRGARSGRMYPSIHSCTER